MNLKDNDGNIIKVKDASILTYDQSKEYMDDVCKIAMKNPFGNHDRENCPQCQKYWNKWITPSLGKVEDLKYFR